MFKNVILLTGAVEAPHLNEIVNDTASVSAVFHADSLETLGHALTMAEAPVMLVAYCTNIIVPKSALDMIEAAGGRAYNFHPAPPAYPGAGSARLAVLDGAEQFGVTAHVLTETVDAGPIIAQKEFPIPDDITGTTLEEVAYVLLFQLFQETAPALFADQAPQPLAGVQWGTRKLSRAEMAEIKKTPPTEPDAAERHARAFG